MPTGIYERTEKILASYPRGERHYCWRGSEAGDRSLHIWVSRIMGKPRHCSGCGTKTATSYEWANISGKYKRDVSDYKRLCKLCHVEFDKMYGENLPQTKLREFEVRQIRDLYLKKVFHSGQLCKIFGVTQSNILAIVNHKSWRRLK